MFISSYSDVMTSQRELKIYNIRLGSSSSYTISIFDTIASVVERADLQKYAALGESALGSAVLWKVGEEWIVDFGA
jgi:hypothetical protein